MIQNSRRLYRFAALGLCGLIPTIVAVVDVPTKPAQIISGHTDPVYGLAFTADGKQLVSGAFDKTIRVWDVATGKESAKLEGHTDLVLSVAISPDGKKILSGSLDKSIRLWDFPGSVAILTPAPPAKPAEPPKKTETKPADAKKEAAKPADPAKKDAVKKEAAKKEEPKKAEPAAKPAAPPAPPAAPAGPVVLAGSGGQVYCVAFFPDGQRAVSGAADKALRIWDLAKKTPIKAVEKAAENTIYSVAVSPKGDLIATAGDDKLVKFFQPADGKELRKAAGHTAAVYTVAFSPDGAKLASGSVDKTVRIWNVADAKELAKLSGHPDDVYSLNFSKDGTRLASAGYAGNVLVWDLASSKEKFRIKLPPSTQAYTVAFAPDGKRVAVGASDAKIYLFDIP